jgi:hypothetical protein
VRKGQQPRLLPPVFKDQAALLLLKLAVDVGGGAGLPPVLGHGPDSKNSDTARGRKGRATVEGPRIGLTPPEGAEDLACRCAAMPSLRND